MAKRAKRGRPRKLGVRSRLVAFRLPVGLLQRLERYASRLYVQGRQASRADGLRHLLEHALDDEESRQKDFHESFREVMGILGNQSRNKRARPKPKSR